ncbi:lactonase family protein [Chitinophagaceae bacterium MMS25-I14]
MNNQSTTNSYHLLVGTYTSGESEGIYVYDFNCETADSTLKHVIRNVANPSYLITSPDRRFVFAVNESGQTPSDHVSSFHYNAADGSMQYIGQVASGGVHPCHLSTDKEGKRLFISNYTSGSLEVADILPDGNLHPIQVIQHEGRSINTERQERAHVHSAVLSPGYDLLFTADLGTDTLQAYNYNASSADAPLSYVFTEAVQPGAGPRHFVFAPDGQYAYLVQELDATITVYFFADNRLEHVQTISITSDDFKGENSAAEILVSPDGKHLYASNRGSANEITAFSIDPKNGTLNFIEAVSTRGKTPRNFILTPDGKFVLIAHQDSDDIQIFSRDEHTGRLTHTGKEIKVPAPVCLTLVVAG